MEGSTEYHLRCELRGHAEDVRAVYARDSDVVTASRDKTLILWSEDHSSSGLGAYKQAATLVGHTNFVTAVTWLPPSLHQRYPTGAFVSGSRDNTVVIWSLDSCSPAQVLEGHSYQISSVCVGEGGSIVSCSLDRTIRVWDLGSGEAKVLQGHEGPVLCCIVLSNGDILSGSGDTTVRRWSGGRCVSTIKAHTDTVRGLAEFPGLGFVSASHDQTLKVWTHDGQTLAELVGHRALVYAVTVIGQSHIISASEDRTCRVWTPSGSCLQTIEHPSCVWDVAALPNGDFISACGDYQGYVWSTDSERCAPEEVAVAFSGSLPAANAQGGESSAALPDGLTMEPPEALMQPGRPGQTKIISEGGGGMAYTWNAENNEWEKIGQVVGGPGVGDSSNMAVDSKLYNGQMWDFVFDVDVADGAPPLKLALNRNENPYVVADRFLEQHQLPATYKEQVVAFILQNTGGSMGGPSLGPSPDPFTGGGAYVPGSGAGFPAPGASGGAPFVTGGGVDPFTGSSGPSKPTLQHCPLKVPLTWNSKLGNPAAVLGRVAQLNADLGSSLPDLALQPPDVSPGGPVEALLTRATGGHFESAVTANPFTDSDLGVLAKLLAWPHEALYPAMDVARLVALSPVGAAALAANGGEVMLLAGGQLGAAVARALGTDPNAAPSPASQQTCLKLLANCCCHTSLKSWLLSQAAAVLDLAARCINSPKPAVQLAHATMVMNISLLLHSAAGNHLEVKTQALSGVMEMLLSGQADELLFRALVTAGTLLHGDKPLQSLAQDLGLADVVRAVPSRASDPKVAQAAKEVEAIMAGAS
mmetsp:Transcript_12029/g.33825  ORF Transcript_12029/g.33825 Transcript_12029/m.33825 type:complete len:812 (-) Transcript_12029:119-2554(-)